MLNNATITTTITTPTATTTITTTTTTVTTPTATTTTTTTATTATTVNVWCGVMPAMMRFHTKISLKLWQPPDLKVISPTPAS